MTKVDRDLQSAAAAAVICAAVVVTVPLTAVRALFAVPLCLALPGYAIATATFAPQRLRTPQTLMLVPALSLAALVLASLLLSIVPGGLRLGSWTVVVLVIVLGGCSVAAFRRERRAGSRHPVGDVNPSSTAGDGQPRLRLRPRVRRSDALLLSIGALVVIGGFVFSRIPLGARSAVGYTELWMQPHGTSQAPLLRIAVLSAEQHPTTYRLVLQAGSGPPSVVDSRLNLRPGAAAEFQVPLEHARRGPLLVTANLYRSGSAALYRYVTAVIPAAEASSSRVAKAEVARSSANARLDTRPG